MLNHEELIVAEELRAVDCKLFADLVAVAFGCRCLRPLHIVVLEDVDADC